jgi:hypothetical protein
LKIILSIIVQPLKHKVNAKIGTANAQPAQTGNNKLQAPPDLKIGPNKFQITISKSQIRSKATCLEF